MYMFKSKLFLAIAAMLFTTALAAQTINIDDARFDLPAGYSYSAGGNVTIPISTTGCFDKKNVFTWKLFNSSNAQIATGTSTVFYATFINTLIPAGTAAGSGYYYTITASTAGSTPDQTHPFSISATTVNATATPVDTNKILKPQYYYGICDGISIMSSMDMKNNSTGGIDSLELIDNYRTGVGANNYKIVPNGTGNFSLTFLPTLIIPNYIDAYYTAIVKSINGTTASTIAYHVINSSWDISTAIAPKALGVQNSCAGDTVKLFVVYDKSQTKNVQQNFPGALILIEWNSTSAGGVKDTLTQCNILAANGYINHYYAQGSCTAINAPVYKVAATVTNPFNILNGPGLTGTCGAVAKTTVDAQVYSKPKASFKMDSVVCLGDTFKLVNLSNPGQGPAVNGTTYTCSNFGNFTWAADNVVFYQTTPSTKSETPRDTFYVYNNLNDTGYHKIKLTVNNNYQNQSPCAAHDTTLRVCIDTGKVLPAFIMIDSTTSGNIIKNDSVINCAPLIRLVNQTHRSLCLDSTKFKYKWEVFDANNPTVLTLPSNYTWIKGNADSMNPIININKTGKYLISLRIIKPTCDSNTTIKKYVEANGDAGVYFTPNLNPSIVTDTIQNCGYNTSLTINYGTAPDTGVYINNWVLHNAVAINDSVHYDYQASAASNLKYKWTITPGSVAGGDWMYVAPTTDTSAFPIIRFLKKGFYTVSISFTTNCGLPKTATQYVNFQESPSSSLDNANVVDTICHSQSTYANLVGHIDPTKNTDVIISWDAVLRDCASGGVIAGPDYSGFSIQSGDIASGVLTPTYTIPASFLTATNNAGRCILFTMTVRPKNNLNCSIVSNTKTLYLRPAINTKDTAVNVCIGSSVNYSIPQPAGTLFDWTIPGGSACASVQSGTNASVLNSVLSGSCNTVTFSLTPKLGTCNGDPFNVTATIRPLPAKPTITMVSPTNAPDYSICSGSCINVALSTSDTSDRFNWVSHIGALRKITGNTSFANQKGSIQDCLTNSTAPLSVDTVTYVVNTVSQYGCHGLEDSVRIIVNPGPPRAQIVNKPTNAYIKLCDSACVTLIGNDPSSIGTGSWGFYSTNGGAAPIMNISGNTLQACGLTRFAYYYFYYNIKATAGGCAETYDTVLVFNYDSLSTPNAGNDTVICDVTGGKMAALNGTISRPFPIGGYEYSIWSKSPTSLGTFSSTSTFTTNYAVNTPHTDTLIFSTSNGGICPDKHDTTILRLFVPPGRGSITYSPIMPQPSNHYCQGSNITFTAVYDSSRAQIGHWEYYIYPAGGPTSGIVIDSSSAGPVNPFVLSNVQQYAVVSTVYYTKGWSYGCRDSAYSYATSIYVDSPSIAGKIKSSQGIDTVILCNPGYVVNMYLDSARGQASGAAGLGWIQSTTSATTGYGGIVNIGSVYSAAVNQTTWFRAIVQNGNCSPDTTKPFLVYIPTAANAAHTGNDTALCDADTFRLIGNTPPAGVGCWKLIAGPVNDATIYPGTVAGVSTFDGAANNKICQNPVIANIKKYGTYQFEWSIENQGCTGTKDTITIKNTPPIAPDTIYANSDTVCKGTLVSFTTKPSSGGSAIYSYTWQKSTGSAAGPWVAAGSNSAVGYPFIADQTTWFRRIVKSDSCMVISNVIQITVDQLVLNNTITALPTAVCTNTAAPTVTGSTPTGGNGSSYIYSWYYGSNSDTLYHTLTNANSTGVNYAYPSNVTDTIHFRRVVTSGKCADTSNYASVTVYPDAKANFISLATSINNTRCATPFYEVASDILNNVALNTTYYWYADTVGSSGRWLVNQGNQLSTYKITRGLDSVKLTLVAVSNNGCKSDSMSMWFRTLATPQADFVINLDTGCAKNTTNATNFSFINTTPNKNLFPSQNWQLNSFALTNYPNADFPPAATFQYAPSSTGKDTTYCITLTVNSQQCGSSTKTKCINIRTKPNVLFSAAPTTQCSGLPILFTNATVGNHLTYQWIFDDNGSTVGSTSSTTVSHTYSDTVVTTHNPKLIATNECASDSAINQVVVIANSVNLNFNIKGGKKYICAQDSVTFYTNNRGGSSYVFNFGDNSSTLSSPKDKDTVTHVYQTAGTYIVTLTGSTSCGVYTKTDTVYVYGKPKASFTIVNSLACKGDTVKFIPAPTFTNHSWSYGSSLDYMIYNATGSYSVQLYTDSVHTLPIGGTKVCYDTSTVQVVTIKDTIPATFTITPLGSSCFPYNVQFANTTNIPTGTPIYTWSFTVPVGTASILSQNGSPIIQQFTNSGAYGVKLVANNGKCIYTDSQNLIVPGIPQGTWVHDTGYKCGATPVNFTVYGNSYTDSVIFSDGLNAPVAIKYTGATTIPAVTYTSGGTYTPSLILKSISGCTYTVPTYGQVRIDYVKANYNIVQNPPVCGSTTVNFVNNSSVDILPSSQTTAWIIDGGTTPITTRNHSITFTASGTHTVSLQTTGISGCTDITAVQAITVNVNNVPQILNVTRQNSACVNQTVYYTLNLAPSQDPIQIINWNFGNGATYSTNGTDFNASNVYGTASTYYDTVTVITVNGCQNKLILPALVINATPSVSITPSNDTIICAGNSLALSASSTMSNTAFTWAGSPNIGLSNTTGASVTVTPADTTLYYVTGTTPNGCADSASIRVGVFHQYNLKITAIPNVTAICKGDSVILKATTDNGYTPSLLTWYPGNGLDTIHGTIVKAKPEVTRQYYVYGNLVAACNSSANQPKDSITIYVGDTLHINFGADTIRLQGGTNYTLTPSFDQTMGTYTWTTDNFTSVFSTVENPTISVANNACYTVAGNSLYNCKDTATLCIRAFCESGQVFIPNTFTPGDVNGNNTHFYVTATAGIKVKTFRVFNRWGQVVFERANFVPAGYKSAIFNPTLAWDGKVKGIIAPTDSYVYTCEVECANGTGYTYTGTVTLIK